MRYSPRYGHQYGINRYGRGTVPAGSVTTTSVLGHKFAVSGLPIFTSIPLARSAWNQFDELGLLVGLSRIRGEDNWAYKRRLNDVFVHRANSSYKGLINGITRELGLSLTQPISINPKLGTGGNFLAPDPYIKFDGIWIYLYSDYASGSLDYLINRYQPGGNYEHLYRLVNLINTTTYFEASFEPDIDQKSKTMTLLNQSSRSLISSDPVDCSKSFRLSHEYIARGSLVFNDTVSLQREVLTLGDVNRAGTYYVDYRHGIVRCYSVPEIGASARYEYTPYPFKPYASEVILGDINNDNFRPALFEQILQDDNTYINGLPTELGVDIIDELQSVTPMYWGI